MDELPEFQRATLDALRQPLEDGYVTVTRAMGRNQYLSRCMLIACMNPCPCGNLGSKTRQCRCTSAEIRRYLNRISGPLLDRIDIQVEMDAVTLEEIESSAPAEDSESIRKRVMNARSLQKERYRSEEIFCNAQLTQAGIEKYCSLDDTSKKLLNHAVDKFHITMRTYGRIRKVARTIADLNGNEAITAQDIALALQYRNVDGQYWR